MDSKPMKMQPAALATGEDASASFQVLSLGDWDNVRDYRKRKMHKKTRLGCLTCRTKRVKCDESRPVCIRCQRNSRPCKYERNGNIEVDTTSKEQEAVPSPVSALSTTTVIPYSLPSARNGTSSWHLMQHFQKHQSEILQIPQHHEIISLFQSEPLVRNSILAITASHLRHVSPGVVQHRIAEHFQQSLALQQYQRTLEKPCDELGQSGVNSLLLSAALLNLLAFALPTAEVEDLDPSSSWVFSNSHDRLGWLAMQAGLRPLMRLRDVAPYFEDALALLGKIFLGSKNETWPLLHIHYDLDSVPELWRTAFRMDDPTNDFFRPPLVIAAYLRTLDASYLSVFKGLQFFGKVSVEFRRLLYERDERAMWLFGYWLGIMCRFEGTWWCGQRVQRDYKAIRMWLEQLQLERHPGEDGKVWKEMMREYDLASAATII